MWRLELDRPAGIHVRRIELDAGGEEALPQLGIGQIEFAVVLPGPGGEQGVPGVVAVDDRSVAHLQAARRSRTDTCPRRATISKPALANSATTS